MSQTRIVEHLKLLANETRLELLGLLASRERSVGELAEIVRLKEPTVSHHLSKLLAGGLVRMRADGTAHLYALETETLHRVNRELSELDRAIEAPAAEAADAWERKVLRSFLDGDRLTKIPEARKKRDVVLRWLVERFDAGRRYGEREVNETIQRHHPDSATLRRELVGARLMKREGGVYWRV
jgi:predicted transcriptional regulator